MFIRKMMTPYNHNEGTIDRIKYIVIHYVGALTDAAGNAVFFNRGERNSSAHYFVGHSGEVWQIIEDKDIAWHCGTKGTYKHADCRNANSIGIEMCCKTTGSPSIADECWYFEDKTVESTVALVKELMAKYNIPVSNVLRHYDVTGKTCPAPYVFNNGKHTWENFLSEIQNKRKIPKLSIIKREQRHRGRVMSNEQFIWNKLKGTIFSFSDYAIAGLMGNLYAESGLRPNNLQNTYEKTLGSDTDYTEKVNNGTYTKEEFVNDKAGYGLAQWTFHSRKRAMYEFIVEKHGKRIDDLDAQLEFLIQELTMNYGHMITALKGVRSVRDASDIVLTQFERPKDQSESVKIRRAEYGQQIFDKYGKHKTIVTEFLVRVKIPDLNIRIGPGPTYDIVGVTGIGTFTIIKQQGNWGLLRSYSETEDGWICLNYVERI